jgi:hypothetical protein
MAKVGSTHRSFYNTQELLVRNPKHSVISVSVRTTGSLAPINRPCSSKLSPIAILPLSASSACPNRRRLSRCSQIRVDLSLRKYYLLAQYPGCPACEAPFLEARALCQIPHRKSGKWSASASCSPLSCGVHLRLAGVSGQTCPSPHFLSAALNPPPDVVVVPVVSLQQSFCLSCVRSSPLPPPQTLLLQNSSSRTNNSRQIYLAYPPTTSLEPPVNSTLRRVSRVPPGGVTYFASCSYCSRTISQIESTKSAPIGVPPSGGLQHSGKHRAAGPRSRSAEIRASPGSAFQHTLPHQSVSKQIRPKNRRPAPIIENIRRVQFFVTLSKNAINDKYRPTPKYRSASRRRL